MGNVILESSVGNIADIIGIILVILVIVSDIQVLTASGLYATVSWSRDPRALHLTAVVNSITMFLIFIDNCDGC